MKVWSIEHDTTVEIVHSTTQDVTNICMLIASVVLEIFENLSSTSSRTPYCGQEFNGWWLKGCDFDASFGLRPFFFLLLNSCYLPSTRRMNTIINLDRTGANSGAQFLRSTAGINRAQMLFVFSEWRLCALASLWNWYVWTYAGLMVGSCTFSIELRMELVSNNLANSSAFS